VWQGFGSGRATGVASVRSCQKLPPCLIEPMSASSKMDPLLTEAEPINDSGSTSEIRYLRRGKNTQWDRERNVRETTLQTPRQEKKEGEEVLQGPEQRFPCSPWRRPW